jgi:repressor of nif and glnA expression
MSPGDELANNIDRLRQLAQRAEFNIRHRGDAPFAMAVMREKAFNDLLEVMEKVRKQLAEFGYEPEQKYVG